MSAPEPAARPVRRPLALVVEEVERLTPGMVRVHLGGDDLDGFGAGQFTDHYVKLQLPPPGASYASPFDVEAARALPREQQPKVRTYTVRAYDAAARRLTIDFVVHGDTGVAGPWAAAAKPGDVLQLMGPGGGYAPDATADWHLMVGDASVLPAIGASLARVPAGVPVFVLVEVDSPAEQQLLETPGELHLSWLAAGEQPEVLVDALRALDLPAGRGQAFVHGEASSVRAVRRHLLAERGLPADALSASGYWKRRRTEEGWREDKAEWNRLAAQDVAVV